MDNEAFFDISYAIQLANNYELDEYDSIASSFQDRRGALSQLYRDNQLYVITLVSMTSFFDKNVAFIPHLVSCVTAW